MTASVSEKQINFSMQTFSSRPFSSAGYVTCLGPSGAILSEIHLEGLTVLTCNY